MSPTRLVPCLPKGLLRLHTSHWSSLDSQRHISREIYTFTFFHFHRPGTPPPPEHRPVWAGSTKGKDLPSQSSPARDSTVLRYTQCTDTDRGPFRVTHIRRHQLPHCHPKTLCPYQVRSSGTPRLGTEPCVRTSVPTTLPNSLGSYSSPVHSGALLPEVNPVQLTYCGRL